MLPEPAFGRTRELARFVANVWMAHPLLVGNTRAVAVFLALYLRSLGFDVNGKPFRPKGAPGCLQDS